MRTVDDEDERVFLARQQMLGPVHCTSELGLDLERQVHRVLEYLLVRTQPVLEHGLFERRGEPQVLECRTAVLFVAI